MSAWILGYPAQGASLYRVAVAHLAAEDIERAYDAAAGGDLDDLVSMFDDEVEWRGPEYGHWLWRRTPS